MSADIFDIGWWIESADDEVYGPVSRATLRRFIEQGVISPNTTVRHCTEAASRPVIDVPGVRDGLSLSAALPAHGDKLAEAWPRKKKEQLALAQDSLPCAWKKRPAVLVCLRCGAPYCEKYRMKPLKRRFYFCRRCQARMYNRRTFAYLLDIGILYFVGTLLPLLAVGLLAGGLGPGSRGETFIVLYYAISLGAILVFLFRDRLLTNAGPGKRLFGLRVVRTSDGTTPLSFGQAFIRWLTLWTPVLGLFDIMVAFRDPLIRRYGDRWSGTTVIDTERRLQAIREKIKAQLAKKGVQLANPVQMSPSEIGRIGV